MDLLSPRPFWPLRDGLPASFPPLRADARAEIAIIGGGISGAFLAALLNEAGHDVVLLDRREVAHGSTAGNTGLMLYELDVMLHRLSSRIGRVGAERAYRRCRDAVRQLGSLVRRWRIDCGYEAKSSLFVAAHASHVPRLRREFEARRAAGLDVEWWSHRQLADRSTLPHSAALCSPGAAQLDPYRLTYALLLRAQAAGARIHDRTAVTRWAFRRHGVELWTSRGHRVRARELVVAMGYEAEAFLPRRLTALHSTFALVTEPLAPRDFDGWPLDRCLMWDTADPYLYWRTTAEGRAMIGGYDEPFDHPRERDRMLAHKAAALRRRLGQFFPRMPIEMAASWAGTFAVTADGLPFIGRHPEVSHTWFALGFGGNGTVFSLIAAEIIREALEGRADPDAALFAFDRPSAAG